MTRPVEIELGASAIDLVVAIALSDDRIRRFEFVQYEPTPGAELRLGVNPGQRMVSQVHHGSLSRITSELLRHDSTREEAGILSVGRAEFLDAREASWGDVPARSAIGLSSVVVLIDCSEDHLPLLDFRVPPLETPPLEIAQFARALGIEHGAVLHSGASYHVYGFELMGSDAWRRLMVRALLAHPFVDTRYIAHRLLSGRGVLRLTANAIKPLQPKVVALF